MNFSLNQLFKGEGKYGITFFFPDAKTDGVLPRFLSSYVFKSAGISVGSNLLLELIDTINKKLYGGIGVNGILSLNNDNIEFKPAMLSFLMAKDIKLIIIPVDDILSIRKDTLLYVVQTIIISTTNGEFKMMVTGDLNVKYFNDTTSALYDKLIALTSGNKRIG